MASTEKKKKGQAQKTSAREEKMTVANKARLNADVGALKK